MPHTASDVPIGNTYDKYASRNPVERRLMGAFFARLDACLPATPPRSILEVGMGEGEVAERVRERFPDARFVGIDLPDPELGDHWRERTLSGTFADITTLPFPDASFDLVLAIEVLEHVDDPDGALRELARVATGALVLSVPREPIWRAANMARGKYLGSLGNTPGHINHWSKKGFEQLVARRFGVREVATPFPWTMVSAHVR
ncbi:MAG: class I SAM-dependent methyltransferase [Acidimicrobiales bacterium]